MPIVADTYNVLVGVDTHAATHTFAVIDAATGALLANSEFPTSQAGLRRALAWVTRRVGDRSCLVIIDGAGSYGAILTGQLDANGYTLAEAPDIPAHVRQKAARPTASTPPRSPAPPAVSTTRSCGDPVAAATVPHCGSSPPPAIR